MNKKLQLYRLSFRTWLVALVSLMLPALCWADITNTAAATFMDSLGNSYSSLSNTVVVTLGVPSGGNPLPALDISGWPAVLPLDGTLTIGNASSFTGAAFFWTFAPQPGAASAAQGSSLGGRNLPAGRQDSAAATTTLWQVPVDQSGGNHGDRQSKRLRARSLGANGGKPPTR